MKAKVERLRMVLVAGTLLLVVIVAGTLAYSRYKAGKLWLDRAKKRSGVSIERETDGFTYSQSMQGKTIFTLHAAKAFQHTGGTWTLHNVVLTLYGLGGEKPDRADRIYGNEFEWDEDKGVAHAVGEVQMDLQVPAGIAAGERHSAAAPGVAAAGDAQSIHVRTSGLVFVREFGVAATNDPIEFRYGGMTCTARGAEFTNKPNSLRLLNDVKAQGVLRGEPVMLTASRADFERTSNTLQVAEPVFSDARGKARAVKAVLHLRRDGSVETAEAAGGVTLDEGTRHVSAARLNAVLNEKNQPQTARFTGGVQLVDEDAARPSRGDAGELLVRFDAQGRPAEATAIGGAHMTARRQAVKGAWLEREARAQSMVATFAPGPRGKAALQQVRATGSVTVRADSMGNSVAAKDAGARPAGPPVLKTNFAAADALTANFTQRGQRVLLQNVHGQGHTTLRQTAAGGEEHTSSGDALDVAFAEGTGSAEDQMAVSSAVQQGHVAILSRNAPKAGVKNKPEPALTGTAARASYDASTEVMTMSGEAHLADAETSLSAATVTVDQRTGDAEARGNVVGTLAGKDAQATHLTASRAVLHRASQVAEFFGGDSAKARLWQQASQVEAGSIVMDRQRRMLTARAARDGGTVHSVFAGGGRPLDGANGTTRAPGVLRVDSSSLEYTDELHQATFTGPVRIDGATGDVRAQRATVFFAPAKPGEPRASVGLPAGGLERVVVSGNVRVEQPGRLGTGEQLVYKAADGSFLLTGTAQDAPRVVDAQQGTVTGSSLLFRAGDSTIVVAGAPASTDGKQPRARIETRVRQKSE